MVNSTITPSRQCNTTCQKIVSFRLSFGTDLLDCLGPKWAVFGSSGRGGVDVNRRGQVRVSSGRTPLAVTCQHWPLTSWLVCDGTGQAEAELWATNKPVLPRRDTTVTALHGPANCQCDISGIWTGECWEWQIRKPELVKRQRRQLWKAEKSQRRSDAKSEVFIIERKIAARKQQEQA